MPIIWLWKLTTKGNHDRRRNLNSTRKKASNNWLLKIVLAPYQNGISKIANLLDRIFDNKDLPRLVTQKWIEVYDQSGNKVTLLTKKLELKHQY